MTLCICGHEKDEHVGSGGCMATVHPSGSVHWGAMFCACPRYTPSTVPHPAAPGADGGEQGR